MHLRLTSAVLSAPIVGILVLFLFFPITVSDAQDISPQAAIPGSIQPGAWVEQWTQPGTTYCPNNRQRFITATNESFTLSAPSGEATISVSYNTSRVSLYLARTTSGNYVSTSANNWWVHLLEATPLSPTQMALVSTFYAKDGSCTLTNYATWSFSSAPSQTCTVTPTSSSLNKRSGPGLNFPIVGQLGRNATATVINVAYDGQGRRWWLLSDNSWVSAAYTNAQGNCPT
jgi:hypothetical protein